MKKVIVFFGIFSLMQSSVIVPVNTMEVSESAIEINGNEEIIKEFITVIENNENRIIEETDIVSTSYDEITGYVSIVVNDGLGGVVLYETTLKENPSELYVETDNSFITFGLIDDLIGIILVIQDNVSKGCAIIQSISGTDVCGSIGNALLQSLVVNARYEVSRVFVKNPNCQPAYSQYCNSAAGGGYWTTKVRRLS